MKLNRQEALRLLEILYDMNEPEERRRLAYATLRGMVRILFPLVAEIDTGD